MSTSAEFPVPGPFKEALKNLRTDSSDVNWLLVGHTNGNINALEYRLSGSGGLAELEGHFKDDEVMYALVRLKEEFDLSTTVKFVYIHWIGSKVPFTKKGRYGIVHGSVMDKFGQSHFTLETSSREDLTEAAVMKLVNETSGTKSKVMETSEAAARKDRGFTSSSNIVKTGKQMSGVKAPDAVSMKFDDEVLEAIADVRSDETQTDWCVVEYQANNPKNPIVLRSKGTDGLDGIKGCLEEDKVAYALLRVPDVLDGISTVKFVYLQWVGENVKPMMKGKISANKSSMDKVFNPFHVLIYATNQGELLSENIIDKVSSASGSKSHVKK
ncbi:uncharacterized protein LOC116291949 [Actinia tenebrosa]|uniref:Coactosin-like protein n=1 Tax=Actinia tenebrosa TaxID=6105 RepID=A0A6P8HQV9_ACTTE|nr:uncharacterized protein LOC116291949 [Actinia tenebrosa]